VPEKGSSLFLTVWCLEGNHLRRGLIVKPLGWEEHENMHFHISKLQGLSFSLAKLETMLKICMGLETYHDLNSDSWREMKLLGRKA
jgi:hypothetical protein